MENILDELKCPVCLSYCEDAMNCELCFKVFCNECVFVKNEFLLCPMCRKDSKYAVNILARRMIGNIEAECPNKCESEEKLTKNSLKSHLIKCSLRDIICKLCKNNYKKLEFVSHIVEKHSDSIIEEYEDAKLINFINFTTRGKYIYNGKTAGTNKLEDLINDDLNLGICSISPAIIIIEFDRIYKFKSLNAAGWYGDETIWNYYNGSGSNISVSLDGKNWVIVGKLDLVTKDSKNRIKIHDLSLCEAKFIKFDGADFIGLGHLTIPYQ